MEVCLGSTTIREIHSPQNSAAGAMTQARHKPVTSHPLTSVDVHFTFALAVFVSVNASCTAKSIHEGLIVIVYQMQA